MMEDFDETEIKFILDCCTSNLKASVEDIGRFSGKLLMSKLDDIIYQHTLVHKLQSKAKDKRNIEILLIWCRMCRDIGSFKPSTKQQRKWLKVNIKSDQVFSQN